MTDWTESLNPAERQEWDSYVTHFREETVSKIAESAVILSLVPEGDFDVKFAVELGASIMLDKPVVAIVTSGCKVTGKLRQVADAIIKVDDIDTEAGQAELMRKLKPVLEQLGIPAE